MKARVYVTLRPVILDPQGEAVHHTLGRLGFDEVKGVRVGKFIELELNEADPVRTRERIEDMCKKLLANTVIENYRIEVG